MVRRNQRQILRLCDHNDHILLQPVNRVEHYYHFLFDLILPLWRLIDAAPSHVTFYIKPFGIFTERVQQLFPGRVEFFQSEVRLPLSAKAPLLGMNARFVQLNGTELAAFKRYVCATLEIEPTDTPNKVLLIERLPPQPYFVTQAVKKGGGASRRSIPNHAELASALQSAVKPPFEFQNVQLEKIPFSEQVRLFDSAAVVVGQHGAGLANCVWMQPGSQVVELSNNTSLDHFLAMCRAINHDYFLHRTSGAHATIDVDRFLSDLLCHQHLQQILRRGRHGHDLDGCVYNQLQNSS